MGNKAMNLYQLLGCRCAACGRFTPSKMKEDNICLFCVTERDRLYDEVGWDTRITKDKLKMGWFWPYVGISILSGLIVGTTVYFVTPGATPLWQLVLLASAGSAVTTFFMWRK